MSESTGVKRECKKSGENSRQMAPVSTICDEYCRLLVASRNVKTKHVKQKNKKGSFFGHKRLDSPRIVEMKLIA